MTTVGTSFSIPVSASVSGIPAGGTLPTVTADAELSTASGTVLGVQHVTLPVTGYQDIPPSGEGTEDRYFFTGSFGWSLQDGDYRVRIKNYGDAAYGAYSYYEVRGNHAPTASIIAPTNNATVTGTTPTFTIKFTDIDTLVDNGTFSAYQLKVKRVSDGVEMWDSGIQPTVAGEQTAKQASKVYAGTALVNAIPYQVYGRVQDGGGLWSDYSPLITFTPNAVPGPPIVSGPSGLQNSLTPTISGTYVQGTGTAQAAWQYEVLQNAATIYSSGDIATAIATGQAYGTNNAADTPASPPALAWGTSYSVRARTKDTTGAYSDWSIPLAFRTNAAPLAPANVTPNGGAIVGTSTPTITWQHQDPDGDAQTAADVELYDLTAAAFVTGYNPKVLAQSGQSHAVTVALTLNHQYQIRVRTKGLAGPGYGPWSVATTFTYSTVPTVSITSPAANAVLTVPTLPVSHFFSGGSGTQQSYRMYAYAADGTTVLYDSGTVAGTAMTANIPAGIFHNLQSYFVQVAATDTLGQMAITSKVPISTNFTTPAPVGGIAAVAQGSQP